MVSKGAGSSTFWLLLFEPLSIAFETLQAVMVHGLQLIDAWRRHSADDTEHCQGSQPSDRNCGFFFYGSCNLVDGLWTLFAHLVALRFCIPSCRCYD